MKQWLVVLLALCAFSAAAKDYLVVASRPNRLHVIDLAARRVSNTFEIPGNGVASTITLPKDGKVAYVLTNRNESVVGIDLESGKQVFRADMSEPGVRVKSMFAVAVSQDGKQLFVHQIPTRIKANEYEVLPTRIAVYRTADGVGAAPARVFPAPRRIGMLAAGPHSNRFLALGWDMYVFDAATGKIDKTFPLRNWKREGMGEPDLLAFWPQYEQAGVFSAPYYAPRTNVEPTSPEAFQLGMLTFDLDTEKMAVAEVANAETAIFSSVVNPVNRNEVFTVMNQVTRIDLATRKIVKQAPADRSYYAINISSDGKELYLGGATELISVYDSNTLQKTAEIVIPGGHDQGASSLRIIQR
jgi:quinohemoprotein amine dehydrogenase beta subunit